MCDRLIRAVLVVGGVSLACAWTRPGMLPEADPVAVRVRIHPPLFYRAVVAWYDVAPGVAVFLAGQFLISTSRIWFARCCDKQAFRALRGLCAYTVAISGRQIGHLG